MSTDINDRGQVEKRLWDEIDKKGVGMLGLVGANDHFQPMTAFVERGTGSLWFFTRRDTDLAREIGQGGQAMFVYQRDDIQACIGGRLSLEHDRARMERYWNAVVAAWYPDGKDDPQLTLLRLDADDAQVWITEAGPVKFAWEIAHANATRQQPDLGGRTDLNLH